MEEVGQLLQPGSLGTTLGYSASSLLSADSSQQCRSFSYHRIWSNFIMHIIHDKHEKNYSSTSMPWKVSALFLSIMLYHWSCHPKFLIIKEKHREIVPKAKNLWKCCWFGTAECGIRPSGLPRVLSFYLSRTPTAYRLKHILIKSKYS